MTDTDPVIPTSGGTGPGSGETSPGSGGTGPGSAGTSPGSGGTGPGSDGTGPGESRWTSRTRNLLIAAAAVVLLLVGATAGLALSGRFGNSTPATPDNASVEAGFARDMIVHHDQGVLMAHYAEQNTDDPEISVMAYDIGYTQTDQLGQMQGWLSLWDLPESGDGTHMGWMGSSAGDHGGMAGMSMTPPTTSPADASSGDPPVRGSAGTSSVDAASAQVPLMPGMATNSEISKLQSLRGTESDIYFLQLMVRHHQGGTPMMQYAAENATNPVVRNFAGKMADAQGSEISVMTQMLAQRGALPLPTPTG